MAERTQPIAMAPRRPVVVRAAESVWDDIPAVRREARGRRVARDLVELSRLQRGEERALLACVDLAGVLRGLCAAYRQPALTGPDEILVNTDPRRLARVVAALLDNAYLHGAPPISVHYGAAEIVVADCGPGIQADLLERATDPFVTGERARGRGVGLGLAIAAHQAALLGAQLRLSNAPHSGAVARIWFDAPGAQRATGAQAGFASSDVSPRSPTPRCVSAPARA
jgi:signal transduction histidine kinase